MRLGGIDIPGEVHCAGHSDGDAICHAVTDAILGAAALGDIGQMFPDTDPANKGRDSIAMLKAAVERLWAAGYRVHNVDVTVIAQRPKIGPHREAMRARMAGILGIDASRVSVKATTTEKLGFTGRQEGIAAQAMASVRLPE